MGRHENRFVRHRLEARLVQMAYISRTMHETLQTKGLGNTAQVYSKLNGLSFTVWCEEQHTKKFTGNWADEW